MSEPDGEEVHELLSLAVEELSILVRRVDQLEDERSTGDDAVASRKKVPEKKEDGSVSLLLLMRVVAKW